MASNLTYKQRALVLHLVQGHSPTQAARLAGYATTNAGYAMLRSPAVQKVLRKELEARILDDAGAARRLLRRFVDDEQAPPKIRLDSAKTLLDRAGIGAKQDPGGDGKELHELSQEELRDRIGRLEGELAERSTVVLRANGVATDDQAPDFLE